MLKYTKDESEVLRNIAEAEKFEAEKNEIRKKAKWWALNSSAIGVAVAITIAATLFNSILNYYKMEEAKIEAQKDTIETEQRKTSAEKRIAEIEMLMANNELKSQIRTLNGKVGYLQQKMNESKQRLAKVVKKRNIPQNEAAGVLEPMEMAEQGLKDIAQYTKNANVESKRRDKKYAKISPFISAIQAELIFKDNEFYDYHRNRTGRGIDNVFQIADSIISDKSTNLMWQRFGSQPNLTQAQANRYLINLNARNFSGYSDWRLPTLEEAMSLMEPEIINGLHIHRDFGRNQESIITSDKINEERAWFVYYKDGIADYYPLKDITIRAVRAKN